MNIEKLNNNVNDLNDTLSSLFTDSRDDYLKDYEMAYTAHGYDLEDGSVIVILQVNDRENKNHSLRTLAYNIKDGFVYNISHILKGSKYINGYGWIAPTSVFSAEHSIEWVIDNLEDELSGMEGW